jgi:Flp pilus assembly protein TadD
MTSERLDEWDAAEADFRASLALNPGNPSVLNYLGYSLVDRGLKFDEALGMIETAVAARPDSGAIVDSLAWVYYKLGRYQEAVAPMERAAELEPNDPILSDHLGDVYWMVGRDVEARFQWRRALSFEPEQAEADRIRHKLSVGLDAVYADEGVTPAAAVEIANDDN